MCNLYSGMPSADYEGETRSIRLGGHSTSIRIEVMFWNVLEDIAAAQGMPLPRLVTLLYDEVLALHGEARNFASLLRCACLRHLEMKADRLASAQRRAVEQRGRVAGDVDGALERIDDRDVGVGHVARTARALRGDAVRPRDAHGEG